MLPPRPPLIMQKKESVYTRCPGSKSLFKKNKKDVQKKKPTEAQEKKTRQERVNRRLPSLSLSLPRFIINPSLHPSIGSHAVRLYWGGAECVYKVTTRANSWPLGRPRSQQTINPANVNWDNQRKRPHLWFAACKHFNTLRRASRLPPGSPALTFVSASGLSGLCYVDKTEREFGKTCFPSALDLWSFCSVLIACRLYKGALLKMKIKSTALIPGSRGNWRRLHTARNRFPAGFCPDGENKRDWVVLAL